MAKKTTSLTAKKDRVLNARRDTIDFRDRMFVPTLVEVPTFRDLKEYRTVNVPILDQGKEGACTGYGLASVVNYLFRTRKQMPSTAEASADMLYRLARRYDEWPGEQYDGSSARGAMKGWNKHGVCSASVWKEANKRLTPRVSDEAVKNPLGAYYRVNHKDLVAMHCAITETGILYATANVHEGWDKVTKNGIIPLKEQMLGGHAFAIVAYDDKGFWIQNSWGNTWGMEGFACITYDDWLANGTDVWVARLGVPVQTLNSASNAVQNSGLAPRSSAISNKELRPHIISLGNDGLLKTDGTFGNDKEDVTEIINGCAGKKVVLYTKRLEELQLNLASQQAEVQRLREAYLPEQHLEARRQKDSLVAEVATLRQQIEDLAKDRLRLEGEIGKLKQIKQEIEARLAEKKSFEEKEKLVKFLRNQVFKNVSGQLSERFREEISLRADRIYRTIAETDEELVWGDEYRIMLRDMVDGQVRERSDDQLSGGQTMSAVVALRLALLQTIGARIAFFDEPTSNLDVSRRENLAHAFRAIDVGREEVTEHWYDQLFLISHDVAFTEVTDQMIKLGES
jgi:hypothetical protein